MKKWIFFFFGERKLSFEEMIFQTIYILYLGENRLSKRQFLPTFFFLRKSSLEETIIVCKFFKKRILEIVF